MASESLLHGDDVLAVLPTGYGKSLILQLYILVAQLEGIKRTALVVYRLQSIIDDQVAEGKSLGISAVSLADVSEQELKASEFELLFSPAERVVDKNKRFLNILKNSDSPLNRNLSAIVIDESHSAHSLNVDREKTMEEMEIEYSNDIPEDVDDKTDRGLKRSRVEVNENEIKEKLTRSVGSHKLTIHRIEADTYAYNMMQKDSNMKASHSPAKRCRLTSDEAERVIQTSDLINC